MDTNKRVASYRELARKLMEYSDALNSRDRIRWERAFEDTWHPDGIINGRNVAALRDRHLGRMLSGRTPAIHVIRSIDDYRLEFTTELRWKRDGPFVATFRDGRIYRVL